MLGLCPQTIREYLCCRCFLPCQSKDGRLARGGGNLTVVGCWEREYCLRYGYSEHAVTNYGARYVYSYSFINLLIN